MGKEKPIPPMTAEEISKTMTPEEIEAENRRLIAILIRNKKTPTKKQIIAILKRDIRKPTKKE